MNKIKKDDVVRVISGRDKGKTGKVKLVKGEMLLIAGINMVKKHVKPNPNKGETGRIMEKEMPIHISNVMLVDENSKASRVGIRTLEDGQRVRYFKTTGTQIDIKA